MGGISPRKLHEAPAARLRVHRRPTLTVPMKTRHILLFTAALTCSYADFGEFEAKGTTSGTLTSSGSLFETPSGSAGCSSGTVTFFSSSNPAPANTAQIRYTVKVKPIGYFGKRNAPTDRFDGSTTIYTQ